MTRADFYVLARDDDHSRYLTVCRLAEKAFRQGLSIHIQTQTPEEARELDLRLWSFRPDSFIPHGILNTPEADGAAVTLGYDGLSPERPEGLDLLINLARRVPDFHRQCRRIAEVVTQRTEILEATRDHYRFYREQGYTTSTHKLA